MRIRQNREGAAALFLIPWKLLGTGGWLVAAGMKRGSIVGGILAAAGGALLYRAFVRPAPDAADRRPLFARGLVVKKAVFVHRSPRECYEFWRNLENLSGFMEHVQSVRVLSPKRSRWVARSVGGTSIEWDAEIVKDEPGRMIGWRSLSGSPLQTAGSVRFEPDDGGAHVIVTLKYEPPTGKIGTALAALFGESPGKVVRGELNRFKELMEAKTIPAEDPVELSSEDSFPASDPPAWTGARA